MLKFTFIIQNRIIINIPYMFGGRLLTNHIQSLNYKNCLLAVFSNQLYIFDLNQTQIIKKISLSDHLIKTWTFFENQNQLIALDETGSLVEVVFAESKKNNDVWYDNLTINTKKLTKGTINDARIVHKTELQSSYIVYFAQQDVIYEYQNGAKNVILKQSSKILYGSQNYLICVDSSKQNSIKILDLKRQRNQEQISFVHSSPITACAVYESNLIIGDQKGKILQLRNYLHPQRSHQQQITTKYQWHVHGINGLFLDQEYLYSCGEEGTVVMWHLRQNKKDFLPRIGTQIDNVIVVEGIVYCLLKDNSIAAVDLSNDKLLKYYKAVISPFGFQTRAIKEKSTQGRKISLVSSEFNNRNLLVASALPGSLQIINLNDGSNHDISVLPRNMISRIDDYYPEPHDIVDVNFNKDWTLMCCSTFGVNHNYLHFYKNQGYNLEYTLVSRVQNPHQGPIRVIAYNNNFITYAQNQKTIRFWSRVRRAKKSIIEKEEEYFICSGEINYRQKSIQNCHILVDEHLLLVNFEDEIILIDLKKRSIQMAFKGPAHIQKALLVKKPKNAIQLVLVTPHKISSYELNRSTNSLSNLKTIYVFENDSQRTTQCTISSNAKMSFLINYSSHQVIFEYDFTKHSVSTSFSNQDTENVVVLGLCYQSGKLIAFGSDSTLTNLTNSQEIVKLTAKKGISITAMDTEEETASHFEHETFESIHRNYVQKQNVRNKGEINQCLQKIQLEMYPSLGFSFTALSQKMLI